jgi:hypothetical protein
MAIRPLLKKLCQCIGIAALVQLHQYIPLLGGGYLFRLSSTVPLTTMVLAHIADIFLLAPALLVLLLAVGRTRYYSLFRLLLEIAIPVFVFHFLRLPHQPRLDAVFIPVWSALLLLLYFRFNHWYAVSERLGGTVAVLLFAFAMFSIGQMLSLITWRPGPQQILAAWRSSPQPPRTHPLVVWILFDELSYDQLFEHRAAGLQLPNFDALRAQSTTFTNVQPAGDQTARIIPSLLTGKRVDNVRLGIDNAFRVHYSDGSGWHPLHGADTVFADANRYGWRTAVVGWYNPYCTAYGDAIQDCQTYSFDLSMGWMNPTNTVWQNIQRSLAHRLPSDGSVGSRLSVLCSLVAREHARSQIVLQQEALQMLRTDQEDFVLLHLPFPHPPATWSRQQNTYNPQCGSSYLDSLAQTDNALGAILEILHNSPRWNDTSLVVQGDHSWRTYSWREHDGWTPEDGRASRNTFDPRPALFIHQAAQLQPRINATAWPETDVHKVLLQLVQGQAPTF